MIPIQMMSVGEACRIIKIRGNDEVKKRLAGLGFVDGANVCVAGHCGKGCLILCLGDSRVALDNNLSSRIMVTPLRASEVTEFRGGHACEESARCKVWQHG